MKRTDCCFKLSGKRYVKALNAYWMYLALNVRLPGECLVLRLFLPSSQQAFLLLPWPFDSILSPGILGIVSPHPSLPPPLSFSVVPSLISAVSSALCTAVTCDGGETQPHLFLLVTPTEWWVASLGEWLVSTVQTLLHPILTWTPLFFSISLSHLWAEMTPDLIGLLSGQNDHISSKMSLMIKQSTILPAIKGEEVPPVTCDMTSTVRGSQPSEQVTCEHGIS